MTNNINSIPERRDCSFVSRFGLEKKFEKRKKKKSTSDFPFMSRLIRIHVDPEKRWIEVNLGLSFEKQLEKYM